jgi:group I intron endonuclease
VFDGPYSYISARRVINSQRINTGAYMLVSLDCSWIYVGSSNNLNGRLADHIFDLKRGIHPKNIIQKYFDENKDFMIFIQKCDDREEAYAIEQQTLDILKDHSGLLNVALDSKKAWIRGLDYINPNLGLRRDTTVKARLSEIAKQQYLNGRLPAMLGRKLSQEARNKISAKAKGRACSEVVRESIRHHHRIGTFKNKQRPVMIDGKEYNSVKEASLLLGVPYGTVHWRVITDKPQFKDWKFKTK